MFQLQKDYLRAIVNTDKRVIRYFPRQMGKTYVRNYIKALGKTATPPNQIKERKV